MGSKWERCAGPNQTVGIGIGVSISSRIARESLANLWVNEKPDSFENTKSLA